MRKMTVRVAEDGSEEPTKLGLLATDLSTKLQTGGKVVAGSLAASTSKVGKGFTAVGGKLAKKVTKSEVVQVWCLVNARLATTVYVPCPSCTQEFRHSSAIKKFKLE